MTVLNDIKIKEYLGSGKIGINPEPEDIQIQPASVDLRLDTKYVYYAQETPLDTRRKYKDVNRREFNKEFPLILEPFQFMLCQTLESVKIPDDLLARVEGRSSIGRLGVAVHITAGFIDPGFEGNITLEIINLNSIPVVLYPYQRVCQIVFEELNDKCERPYGSCRMNKYQNQSTPTPTEIFNDLENG